MTDQDADSPDSIDGLDLDDAVGVITSETTDVNGTVRTRLERVSENGVVQRDALDDVADEVSAAVSTAESHVEAARAAFEDAESTAEPVSDVASVAFRIDRFGSELDDVESLGGRLRAKLDDAFDIVDDGEIYAAVRELERASATADRIRETAEYLQEDLTAFEAWLDDPEVRLGEVEGDLDALERSLAGLRDAVNWLYANSTEDAGPATGGDADPSELTLAWADATLRIRVLKLFLTDVRGELDDLGTLAERKGADADETAPLDARVDELHEHCDAIATRLDDLAQPDWRDAYDDHLDAFEGELDAFDPPVDWDAVEETLETFRSRIGATDDDQQ